MKNIQLSAIRLPAGCPRFMVVCAIVSSAANTNAAKQEIQGGQASRQNAVTQQGRAPIRLLLGMGNHSQNLLSVIGGRLSFMHDSSR
jgi:hypothetical protein